MRKYIINFLLVFVLCTLCIRFPVSANEVLYSGQCGDDVYWTLDENGTMTLSGSGKMWNYAYNQNNSNKAVVSATALFSLKMEEPKF